MTGENKRTRMSPAEVEEGIIDCFRARLVPFVKGSPGNSKSSVVHAVAARYNLMVIDERLIQLEPPDLKGYPDVGGERATYKPLDTFPLDGDPLPLLPGKKRLFDDEGNDITPATDCYKGWLLFFDEFNGGSRATQAAAYKPLLDHLIGQKKLHENLFIACAGNLDTDNAYTNELNTAIQSRVVHMEIFVSVEDWLQWAHKNGVDRRVTSYISWAPGKLNTFAPDHEGNTYGCPRTWHFVSRLIESMPTDVVKKKRKLLSGTVGEGEAAHFVAFLGSYANLPNLADILRDPQNTRVPAERQIQFALTGTIAGWFTEQNADELMKYIVRLPREMQIICLRQIVATDPDMLMTPALMDWTAVNGAAFWGGVQQVQQAKAAVATP